MSTSRAARESGRASAEGYPHADASSTFKFLITTDNHLGYQERDPRRGNDSFTTFEECLRAARVEHDVDAIILGGDLFHDNKPSLSCLTRTCSLFRKYVLGDKPIRFALLSDPQRNFPTHAIPCANFQDPNVNVALPVFMIHGNHDDPVGGTSAIDILSSNSLVNYFGHVPSLEDIVVEPVLLRKGNTHIALYGLGNVRDERLHRCFHLKKVRFVKPTPQSGVRWFNILVLHQNRGVRSGRIVSARPNGESLSGWGGTKAGIYETMLRGFGMHLVIWGNEHEQLMVPQPSEGFDIIQPGSTILTSLSGNECNPKQYGVLEVRDRSYRVAPFTLRSIRPAVRRQVELRHEPSLQNARRLEAVEDFLRSVVESMIEEAEEQLQHIPDDVVAFHPNIKYPLLRLSVDFTDPESSPFPQPNANRFGQQYMDVCANPGDLLHVVKTKPLVSRVTPSNGPRGGAQPGTAPEGVVFPSAPLMNTLDIRTKIADVFNASWKDACTLLSEPEVASAVYAFVEKEERDAIDEKIRHLLLRAQKYVWKTMSQECAEKNHSLESIMHTEHIAETALKHKWEMNRVFAQQLEVEEVCEGQERQGGAGRVMTLAIGDDDVADDVDVGDTLLGGGGRSAAGREGTMAENDDVTALLSRHRSVMDEYIPGPPTLSHPEVLPHDDNVQRILHNARAAREMLSERGGVELPVQHSARKRLRSDAVPLTGPNSTASEPSLHVGKMRGRGAQEDDVEDDKDEELNSMFPAVPREVDANGGVGALEDDGGVCFVGMSQGGEAPHASRRGATGRKRPNAAAAPRKRSGLAKSIPPTLQLTHSVPPPLKAVPPPQAAVTAQSSAPGVGSVSVLAKWTSRV